METEYVKVVKSGDELLPTDDITDAIYEYLLYDQFSKEAADSIPFCYVQATAKRIAILMCERQSTIIRHSSQRGFGK